MRAPTLIAESREFVTTVIVVNVSFFSALRQKAPCFYDRNPTMAVSICSFFLWISSNMDRFWAFFSLAVVIYSIIGCS